jgi:hypothetical protein
MIKFEYLKEPTLQFDGYFEHEDTKTGLSEFGPFGKTVSGLHPSEIKLGFVGTRNTITLAQDWVAQCGASIESENVKTVKQMTATNELFADDYSPSREVQQRLEKILNRDFVGFHAHSPFASRFTVNERWQRLIDPRELQAALKTSSDADRVRAVAELFNAQLKSLAETSPVPDVVIVALPDEITDNAAESAILGGGRFLNLRRLLKALAMQHRIPLITQLIKQQTLEGRGELQEVATRAWNFCTAQYYKAQGIPWCPVSLERDTCYIGVSFYRVAEIGGGFSLRSSVAQAFDYLGQGLVLRSEPFEWNEDKFGRSPHLPRDAAARLIEGVLTEYRKLRNVLPRRVVIHKTSRFWGEEQPLFNEQEGFVEGADRVLRGLEIEMVALRSGNLRVFREGIYPPLRGTLVTLEDRAHFVYTTGYIPYLETYPGTHIPRPIEIVQHIGSSHPRELCSEILGLTKMNVNNCAFADGIPITLSFARRVGEIMQQLPDDVSAQASYRFFM